MTTRLFYFSLIAFSALLYPIQSISSSTPTIQETKKPFSIASSNKTTTSVIEGSANGPFGKLADVEVNGSGYPTDDEDGDDVHGSGSPLPVTSQPKKASSMSPITSKPSIAVTSMKPTQINKPDRKVDRADEIKLDEEDEDDEEEHEDDDEDEDEDEFADEKIHDDFFTTSTTTINPVNIAMTPTTRSFNKPTDPPRNQRPVSTTTVVSGPFSPFHETMTNGFYAAIAGGILVAIITAILLVLFVVFRIRKKDEGSYALDEPKQTRPYATYAYTKASTKEFYA